MGAAVGIALQILGDRAAAVRTFIEQTNEVVQFLMEAIGDLIPLFVFFSLFALLGSDFGSELSGILKAIVITYALCPLMCLVFIGILATRRRVSFRLTASSAPMRRNPATIVISEKSISSVVVSMPCKCMTDGGVSRKDSSAQTSAALSTVSRRKYCKIRFTMWFCSLWKMQKASGIAPPVH